MANTATMTALTTVPPPSVGGGKRNFWGNGRVQEITIVAEMTAPAGVQTMDITLPEWNGPTVNGGLILAKTITLGTSQTGWAIYLDNPLWAVGTGRMYTATGITATGHINKFPYNSTTFTKHEGSGFPGGAWLLRLTATALGTDAAAAGKITLTIAATLW